MDEYIDPVIENVLEKNIKGMCLFYYLQCAQFNVTCNSLNVISFANLFVAFGSCFQIYQESILVDTIPKVDIECFEADVFF